MTKPRGIKNCGGIEAGPGRFLMKKITMGITLWLISKKPRSGYDLIREFEDEPLFGASFPARVYPILRSMVKMNLVKSTTISHGKREVYVYNITPTGKKILASMAKHICFGLRGKFLREMIGNGGNAQN